MATLLTVREAADRLGVAYSTLKQWIYDGAVRTVRTRGGHHRLSELEVQRLLAAPPGKAPGKPAGKAPAPARQRRETAVTTARGLPVLISGRNQLRGIVEEVRGDGLLAQIRLRIGDQRLTAIITQDAVAELKLRRGDEALAVVKATEVMIARARGPAS